MILPKNEVITCKANNALLTELSARLLVTRDKQQLHVLINTILKAHFGYTYASVFILDKETKIETDYFFDPQSPDRVHPFHREVATGVEGSTATADATPYLCAEGWNGIAVSLFPEQVLKARWILGSDQPLDFEITDFKVLPTVINLLSNCIQQLIMHDQAIEKKTENEIIQSLNSDFALIREKGDLLRIIHFKLKKLFEFGHHWVAVLNEDQLTMTSFLQDSGSTAKDHPKYKAALNARYTTNDRIFNKVLLSKETQLFDLDQLSTRGNMPEYMEIMHESGVKKVIMIGLQVGVKIIGVWAICLMAGQELSSYQLSLIKSIANQLSIAVDNIIANMAIEKKEQESALLLAFSFALTTVRNRVDLLKVIKSNVKKLFPFQDLVIMVSGEDGSTPNQIFSATLPTGSEPGTKEQEAANRYFKKVLESAGIVFFNEEKFSNCCDREMICIGLNENNYNICFFFLTTLAREAYSDHDLELIKGVSYQLSSAVANILANEEISMREKEKELLLNLNLDIGAVRHSDELLNVINERLKIFLGFAHVMIGKINENQSTVSAFLLDPESLSNNYADYEEVVKAFYPINDGVLNQSLHQSGPLVFDLEKLNSETKLPRYLQMNLDSGIKQLIVIRFSKGMHVFGFWLLFFKDKQPMNNYKFKLLESLANQTSIAVSNIMANEEIVQREKEKTRLLAFSNAITSARDKNLLAKVLKKQLQELFGIQEYVIHSLSDDKQTHTPILYDQESAYFQAPEFKKLINQANEVNDGVFDKILASDDPVFFDINQVLHQAACPDYLQCAEVIGLQQMIGVAIRLGHENIAVMNFIHDDYDQIIRQFQLFKSILSQIALTVSNLLANEKLNRQLEEINHYKLQLEEEKIYLKEEIETTLNYAEIVGESPLMQKTFRLVAQVAPADSTVLLLGETGTGKELIARAIHNNSPRKNKLMVKVNCAALPVHLIESELFGHERGSFTGATERRLGKFELANNGTLFLDEIGEMPLDLQVKLLRALQEREIERIGGNTTIKVNVRIIAATNRDLEKEMEAGRFRSDLYYRLNIFPIELPPLRDRKADIPLLALYFIQRFAKKSGKEIVTLNSRAMEELVRYRWPGNIRELEHLIERSVLLASGNAIKEVLLPTQHEPLDVSSIGEPAFMVRTIDDQEKDFIFKMLKYCNGRIGGSGGAAELLGVPTSTLNSKMKRLGIRREHLLE
jgi:formate hydrogenlyase transcriptional activator